MSKDGNDNSTALGGGRIAADARGLVLLSVGFGCLIGFSRICSLGYWGYLSFELSSRLDPWYALRAICAAAVLAALAAAGWTRRFRLDIRWLGLAGASAVASAIVFAVDTSGAFGAVVAVLGGASMATLLYVWMLLLARYSARTVAASTILGLVLAGFIVEGLPLLGYDVALVVVVAAAFTCAAAAALLDPGLSSCAPDGPFDRSAAARVPWLTVAMFVACGFLASVLYGVSEYMSWLYDWRPDALVFELAAIAGVVATVAIVLRSRAWMHVAWLPLFALLACAVALCCIPIQGTLQMATGFMMASVFCANFLMWVVFPALLGSLEVPRAFAAAVLLVFGNSALASLAGDALGAALPPSMQNLGGVAGLVAMALAVALAIAVVASRRRTGAVGVFEAPANQSSPHAESASAGAPDPPDAVAALRARLDLLAESHGFTPRESEVAFYTVQGFSCAYIADKLVVSNSTVRFHQQNVYRKLEVHSRNELIEFVADNKASEQA